MPNKMSKFHITKLNMYNNFEILAIFPNFLPIQRQHEINMKI